MLNKTFEQAVTVSKRHFLPSIFLLLLIIGVLQPALASEAPKIPMTASRWQIKGDVAFEQDKAKQDILVIKKGYAQLKHNYFSNGTIEFDVKFVGSRITGITFHQRGETADALYFRPSADCAVSDDCIQYMPTAHHVFEWDLYGNDQTRAPINPAAWNHIKLVVADGRMNVFVNGASSPTLAVGTLQGGFPDGSIRLHGPASYANLKIAPNKTEGLSAEASSAPATTDRRYISHWLASAPFVMPSRMDAKLQENTGIDPVYASVPAESATWKPVLPAPGGLINLTRWYGAAQTGPSITGIWLKTTLASDHAQVKHVDIGWTREVWVFVNGKLVYANKNLYGIEGASKEPDGRLSLTNGSFDLPLRKGANHIAVALDDNFGGGAQHFGWGLEMRLADVDGIGQIDGRDARAHVLSAP
jgi:hypothetical protein